MTEEKMSKSIETNDKIDDSTNEATVIEPAAEQEEVVPQKHIHKHLTKPLRGRQKRAQLKRQRTYERLFNKRRPLGKRTLSVRTITFVSLATLFIVFLAFRVALGIHLAATFQALLPYSVGLTVLILLSSLAILFKDRTELAASADPITDFFIVKRGKHYGSTRKRHFNRINTRFMMVTFLKLYQKDEIAIIDEQIILGSMEAKLTKDEVALVNFLLDHNIHTLDDFIEVIHTEGHDGKGKDHLYASYKQAILEMADDKHYINRSINKTKMILRVGAFLYGLIAILLLIKGQGTWYMLAGYTGQAAFLYMIANVVYANSKGAHNRLRQLRKERKLLQSERVEVYTALIYNYIFNREDRVLKRIQKRYHSRQITQKEYQKFSETYNSFNYMLNQLLYENTAKKDVN